MVSAEAIIGTMVRRETAARENRVLIDGECK
jgi:hypothetical protein